MLFAVAYQYAGPYQFAGQSRVDRARDAAVIGKTFCIFNPDFLAYRRREFVGYESKFCSPRPFDFFRLAEVGDYEIFIIKELLNVAHRTLLLLDISICTLLNRMIFCKA